MRRATEPILPTSRRSRIMPALTVLHMAEVHPGRRTVVLHRQAGRVRGGLRSAASGIRSACAERRARCNPSAGAPSAPTQRDDPVIRSWPGLTRLDPAIQCARKSGRYPAGGSPAQVRASARLVASVASAAATPQAKRTRRLCGCAIEPRNWVHHVGRAGWMQRRRHLRGRQARRRCRAGVEDRITRKRRPSVPGRSRVRPGG
jgi:hypothetical protein